MFISKDEAVMASKSRHKLKVCRVGQGWLCCPYVPGAIYSQGHWVPPPVSRWLQCGKVCQYHYLPVITKAHVPALCGKRPQTIEQSKHCGFEEELVYRPDNWLQKIVEITAGCFEAFHQESKPDQLAVVYREGPARNGPLTFRWLTTALRGAPASLAHFDIQSALPAIIHGELAYAVDTTPLDNPSDPRIKHNSNSRNDFNGCNDFDGTPPPEKFVDKIRTHLKGGA